MAKGFKTTRELVELLESRGVETDGKTETAIDRESYYAVVNGYKKPFLETSPTQGSVDAYQQGTKFAWMYDLFLFDRDLRTVTLKYLARAEAVFRTAVSYAFSYHHPAHQAYLDRSNYCTPDQYLVAKAFKGSKEKLYRKNLDDLMRRLNEKLVITRNTRDYIKHYLDKYGFVPLWVLVNDLTFGNMVHLYSLMQENDRRMACTTIARVTNRDSKEYGYLSERNLLKCANLLKDYRNICAHDERLYCANINGSRLSDMMAALFNLLPRDETDEYLKDVVYTYGSYESRLHNMGIDDLMEEMGFNRRELGI